LLRLVLPGPRGRWLTGVLIFFLLLIPFALLGPDPDDGRLSTGVVVFFCVILGYIIPIHHLIIQRSLYAFDQLASGFQASADQVVRWRNRILIKSPRWSLITSGVGVFAGLAHNFLLISSGELTEVFSSARNLLPLVTTLLVWVIMTNVIFSLLDNVLLFRQLAGKIRINLLNVRSLTPFGTVAVSSTLAMIGAQAAFPLMMLEAEVDYVTFVPGLIATGLAMIFMFVLPVWPVHKRLVAAKRAELDRLSDAIEELSSTDGEERTDFDQLNPVLLYRREISGIGEWPFDTSVMGRLAIYLVIPPLTWIGAAFIEILIDSAI